MIERPRLNLTLSAFQNLYDAAYRSIGIYDYVRWIGLDVDLPWYNEAFYELRKAILQATDPADRKAMAERIGGYIKLD